MKHAAGCTELVSDFVAQLDMQRFDSPRVAIKEWSSDLTRSPARPLQSQFAPEDFRQKAALLGPPVLSKLHIEYGCRMVRGSKAPVSPD